jgi:hypothetical protein
MKEIKSQKGRRISLKFSSLIFFDDLNKQGERRKIK